MARTHHEQKRPSAADEPIRLASYEPAWPARFEEERGTLEGASGKWCVERPRGPYGGQAGFHPPRSRLSPLTYAPRLTGHGITVRRCCQDDVPAVLDLWEQARSDHASTTDSLSDVEYLADDSPAALLVAERDGEIVGALIAAWDGWRGNMYRLAVRDGHRRQGIGLALTRAGETYLRQRGARRVTALVAFDDREAGGF